MNRSLSALAVLLLLAWPALAAEIIGQASIIDGDTLDIHGTRIRLAGIDAPEHDQLCDDASGRVYQCGGVASNRLSDWIARRPVACEPVSTDRYRRTVAQCSVAGQNIGEWLVSNGLALRWPLYDREGRYAKAQATAQQGKLGLWGGQFLEPWDYRACVRDGLRPGECSALHP